MAETTKKLESTIEWQKELSNSKTVKEGDITMVYEGIARRLRFDGLDIRGYVILKRTDIQAKMRKKRRFFKILKEPEQTERDAWRISAYYRGDWGDCKGYFVRNGEPVTSLTAENGYRAGLVGNAVNRGIQISNELLDDVFSPIDKQLMEYYKKIKRFYEK